MRKLVLKRVGEGFELSGSLRIKDEIELQQMCFRLLQFPLICFYPEGDADGAKHVEFIEIEEDEPAKE